MKLQRQGKQECKLATIAMLARVNLNIIRRQACEIAGVHEWSETFQIGQGRKFWLAVDTLAARYHLTLVMSNAWMTGSTLTTVPLAELSELGLKGKGELVVRFTNGCAHSVAYENGMIFDPEMLEPMPFAAWLKSFSNIKCVMYMA